MDAVKIVTSDGTITIDKGGIDYTGPQSTPPAEAELIQEVRRGNTVQLLSFVAAAAGVALAIYTARKRKKA